jgi:hypothetical protein
MYSDSRTGGDEEFWKAARVIEYECTPIQILCPADQFLNACELGMYPSSWSGVQWLVDCVLIIRHSPAPFDWRRLVDQSARCQLSLHARATLVYVREHFEDSIPPNVIAQLARVPVTLADKIEYSLAGRSEAEQQEFTHKLGMAACSYLRLKPGGRLHALRHDVPRFFRWLSRGGGNEQAER